MFLVPRFKGFRSLPVIAYFILFGSLFSSASFFMSLPFLALYLSQTFSLGPKEVGLIIGISPLAGMISALWLGALGDRFGRPYLICISGFFYGVAFLGFSFSTQIIHFVLINVLFGISRSTFRSNLSAFLSDIANDENRKFLLQTQFLVVNIGACIGPLAGAYFFLKGHQTAFRISGLMYFAFSTFLALVFYRFKEQAFSQIKSKSFDFLSTLTIIYHDRVLKLYLIGFMINFFAFVQFETNFPQHLYKIFGDSGVVLFSKIMVTNALTIISLQFLLLKIFEKKATIDLIKFGVCLQGVGFVLFGLPIYVPWFFYFSMIVFSIGEIFMIANLFVLLDEISPKNKKSSYFASFELANFGFIFGPTVGGWLYLQGGRMGLFLPIAGLLFVSYFLFRKHPSRQTPLEP